MSDFNLTYTKNYFEEIASKNKMVNHSEDEKHFMYMSFEELFTNQKKGIYYPAMFMHEVETRLIDHGANQFETMIEGGLSIVEFLGKPSDEQIETTIKKCKNIARQIVSRMRRDRIEKINAINFSGIKINELHNVMQGCWGVLLDYNFTKPTNLDYIENEWNI